MQRSLIIIFITSLSSCGDKKENHLPEIYSTEKGAIDGYDPVAFFTEQMPVKGNEDLTYVWKEATWHFSSKDNLDNFKTSPEKFAPLYGGYCAYGTAAGHLSPTKPETWTILDNRLYFNYSMSVKEKWSEDQKGYIENANKNWPALVKE